MRINLLLYSLIIAALLILSAATLNQINHRSELQRKAPLVCRAIGDQLLRHAGDSTSRVLPVKQLGNGMFRLEFQSSFTFVPDTLVRIIQSNIASYGLPEDYTVNVYNCLSEDIVYGFQIAAQQADIVPCLGRDQPYGCYSVQIQFADLSKTGIAKSPPIIYLSIILGISLIAFIGRFYSNKSVKPEDPYNKKSIPIGNYTLDSDRQILSNRFETSILSEIETKLLTILAREQNVLVTRDRLQKEIWEDNGVITSRSLDMFVSKLRKKLNRDHSVRLVNIYGKGYKLEVTGTAG